MKYRVENKKLYLATKLLDFLDNRPSSILFIDPTDSSKHKDLATINVNDKQKWTFESCGQTFIQTYRENTRELISIRAEFLSQLFPELTKKEVNDGLLSLERQGAIQYKGIALKDWDNYEEIKFFNIRPSKSALEHFIAIVNSGLFGFRFSDKDFYKEILRVFEILINSDTQTINFTEFNLTEFHQGYVYDILESIYNFSDAILITKKINDEYKVFMNEDDQLSSNGPEYLPDVIYIKDREGLRFALTYMKKTVNDFYVSANLYLEKNQILDYGCADCGYFIGKCKTVTDIINWLELFLNGGGYKCKKCGKRSIFSIGSNGEIEYSIVNK